MEIVKEILLRRFPDLNERGLVDDLMQESQLMEIPAGNHLIEPHQFVRFIPLVLTGSIKVVRVTDEGEELFLYFLNPGDTCAMTFTCTLNDSNSVVRATAVEDSEILAVPVRLMPHLMATSKNWYRFVISTFNDRYEELIHTLDSVAFHKMDERLIDYLQRHCAISRTDELALSHQQIAQELGTSREVISRLLKSLERDGAVELGRNRIRVIQLPKT